MFKHYLFKVNETPIVLGALLLFITWGANHIVSRVTNSPLIEYKISWMNSESYESWKQKYNNAEALECNTRTPLKKPGLEYMEMRLTNLSDKIFLKNISVALGFPKGSNIKASQLLSAAPAIKGDDTLTCGNLFVKIDNLNFHPLWEYRLIIATEKAYKPHIVLLHSDQATILAKNSFKTWMVRNEVKIILFLLLIGILLTVWYLIELSRETEDNTK